MISITLCSSRATAQGKLVNNQVQQLLWFVGTKNCKNHKTSKYKAKKQNLTHEYLSSTSHSVITTLFPLVLHQVFYEVFCSFLFHSIQLFSSSRTIIYCWRFYFHHSTMTNTTTGSVSTSTPLFIVSLLVIPLQYNPGNRKNVLIASALSLLLHFVQATRCCNYCITAQHEWCTFTLQNNNYTSPWDFESVYSLPIEEESPIL